MKKDLKYYQEFCAKIVKKNANYRRPKYEDRNVLENIIFPWVLANFEPKKIFDIGREEYQKFYNQFFRGRELWSIDFDPACKKWGAKNHIVGDAADVAKYFEPEYFDVIFMNGVYGWGLNEPKQIEKGMAGVYKLLKPGGLFVLGYNDWDALPMQPDDVKALKKFKPFYFEPLKGDKFKCINGEHTYRFYQK